MLTRLVTGYTYDAPRRKGFLDNTVVVKENVNNIPNLKQPTGSNFADKQNSRPGFQRTDPRPRFVDVDFSNQLEDTKQGLKVSLSEKTVKDIAGASKDVIAIESFLQSSQARTPEGIQLMIDAIDNLSGVERQQLDKIIGESGDKIAVEILKGLNRVVPAPPVNPKLIPLNLPPTNQTSFTDTINKLKNVDVDEKEELPDWVSDDFRKQSELKNIVKKMKTSRQDRKEELPDWAKDLFKQDRQKKEKKAQNLLRQGMRRRKNANEEKKSQKEIDDDLASFVENLMDEISRGGVTRGTKLVKGVTPAIATVVEEKSKKRKIQNISNPVSSIISTTTPSKTPTGKLQMERGSYQQVWGGEAEKTSRGGYTKNQLKKNNQGKIVAIPLSQSARNRGVRGPGFASP